MCALLSGDIISFTVMCMGSNVGELVSATSSARKAMGSWQQEPKQQKGAEASEMVINSGAVARLHTVEIRVLSAAAAAGYRAV